MCAVKLENGSLGTSGKLSALLPHGSCSVSDQWASDAKQKRNYGFNRSQICFSSNIILALRENLTLSDVHLNSIWKNKVKLYGKPSDSGRKQANYNKMQPFLDICQSCCVAGARSIRMATSSILIGHRIHRQQLCYGLCQLIY